MRRGAIGLLRAHRARRRDRERTLGAEQAGQPMPALEEAIRTFAWSYVAETLIRYRGDRKRTAEALGISVRTLYRYLAAGEVGGRP